MEWCGWGWILFCEPSGRSKDEVSNGSLGSMHDNILMINIIPKHFPSLVRNYIRQPHTPFKEQHYTCVIFVVLGGYVDQKEARVRGRREKRWESCLAVLSKSSSEATPQ
jgi:hypothetical protein